MSELAGLLAEIRACRLCRDAPRFGPPLPHEPRPVLRLDGAPPILVCGQAPGTRVHASGIPFTDPSGMRLRGWMGVDDASFYDTRRVGIVPMGFCFPGQNARGADLPPRRECALTWHDALFAALPPPRVLVLLGQHAIAYHARRLGLADAMGPSLSETIANWRAFAVPGTVIFPLPHPSWRNNGWLKAHLWFLQTLVPALQGAVAAAMDQGGQA